MKKSDEIEQPNSCLNRAAADEPVFVLRAKDPCAPAAIRAWADAAARTKRHAPAKIVAAYDDMNAFIQWREANFPES